jgi:hypothetical protein
LALQKVPSDRRGRHRWEAGVRVGQKYDDHVPLQSAPSRTVSEANNATRGSAIKLAAEVNLDRLPHLINLVTGNLTLADLLRGV